MLARLSFNCASSAQAPASGSNMSARGSTSIGSMWLNSTGQRNSALYGPSPSRGIACDTATRAGLKFALYRWRIDSTMKPRNASSVSAHTSTSMRAWISTSSPASTILISLACDTSLK